MIEELEEISAIAPESAMMELLAARYIAQVQKQAFPQYINEANLYPQNDIEKSENLQRFQKLLKKMSDNKALKNKYFWSLADAYCGLILKDFKSANQILTSIPANSTYYKQAQALLYVAKLLSLPSLDAENAEKLWVEILENEKIKYNETLIQFFKDVFSLHYQKQGDIARAYLTYFNPYDNKARLDINLLEALEKFVDNCNLKNKYDAFLIEGRYGSISEAKNILNEQKGVYYLQRNMLDKAIEFLSKCDEQHKKVSPYFESLYLNKSIWYESVIHPYFNVEITEQNVSFLYENYPELKRDFNLLSYAQTLKALEIKAAKETAKAAEYYYLLGIAWYNTGVQGWHRPAIYYSESNEGNYAWLSADDKLESPKVFKGYDWLSDRYYTPDIAGNYFEKSLKSSGNDELKAKALYMLAKVEKTRDLEQTQNAWNDTPQYSKRYYEAFKDLKSYYPNTAFYKDILRECTDFGDYVNRTKK
jgi:DNA-directed RNA polymerase subunit F